MADLVMKIEAPSRASRGGRPGDEGSALDRRSEAAVSDAPGSDGLLSSLGGGSPLHPAERSYFEPRFGFAFDKIRIHAGPEAARSAASVQASAYALGNNLVFAAGRYQPGAPESRALLAHEIAHVVQARGPNAGPPVIRRQPDQHGDPDAGPPETALTADGLVTADDTKLYDRAGVKQEVLRPLDKDTRVQVTHEAGSYYRVLVGDTKGYILQSRVWLPAKPEDKKPEKKKPEEKKDANPYQKILDQAVTTLSTEDGETFYHIDPTFGFSLVRYANNTSKQLPAGTGSNEGWLRKKFDPLFKKVGAKPGGPQFYAMVTYQGNYLLARTAHHKHTVLPGGVVKAGDFPDALEAFWVHPDWEKRLPQAK